MWSIHTMGYYSVLKSMKILTHAMWMNLEDIVLRDNEPVTKDEALYDSSYMRYLE